MSDPLSPSYWHGTVDQYPLSHDIPHITDVVVIGGGIVGMATCYWLAKAGISTVVLERTGIAYGATGRNGGYVSIGPAESYPEAIARIGHQTARSVLDVTLQNKALVREVLAEEKISCGYHEPGSVHLALNEEQWKSLEREAIALQGEGISIEMLNREQVQGLIKTPLSAEIIGGRLLAEDGIIHPARFIQGLAHASQRYGAQIYQASVMHVHSHSKGVQVHTVQGSLDARAVIVATNAWISELLPEVSDLITPVRGQILSYAPTASVFPVGLSASVTETGEYWQQRLDGTIIVGGCRAAALGQDRGVYLETPTPEVQHALEQVLPRFFPMLSDLHIDHRWAGLMAFTPDYLPIADQMPAYPHVWVVGGFCGHGMPFGMRLSQLLAEEIARDTPLEELKSFRFDRATLTPSTSRLRLQQLP